MAYTKLNPQHTRDAHVDKMLDGASHYLLSIPAGKADQYRLAQLDDYAQLARKHFPHRSPTSLSLSARVSSDSIPGTWGFGFWNHPFGLSLGFGGTGFRLPTLPNTAWFFGASEENYLSFKEQENSAANGFIVQSFCSPIFHPLLIPAGLALPFSRRTTRRLLSRVIAEEGIELWNPAARRWSEERSPGLQKVDPTQWHEYRLDWREKRVSFEVNDTLVYEAQVSPHNPLGLVIWIDNQYAAFTPEGKIGFGVLENPEPAWLEVKNIEVT
jgi:hypothetical protein